jgi:hypothetical protein
MPCRGRSTAGAGPSLLPCGDGRCSIIRDKTDTAAVQTCTANSRRYLQILWREDQDIARAEAMSIGLT